MKRGSTIFLRAALVAMGLVMVALCALVLPVVHREWTEEFPAIAYAKYPVIIGLLAAASAIIVALYQAFKLLHYIDQNKAFSKLSVKALQNIKYCALVIAGIFIAGMPVVYHIADKDDAPGLILIVGAIFIGAPVVIAVFAGVCQRLFQNAIDIKSENDLTV